MKETKRVLLVLTASLLLAGCGGTTKKITPTPEPEPEPEEGNTEIEFGEITNLIQINEKAQTFIDAMKAQEEEYVDNPFLFTALDGNDKVDPKNYLSSGDNSKNRYITISWPDEYTAEDGMKLLISTSKFFEEENTFTYDVTGTSYSVDNLFRATTYYYRLQNDDKSIQSQFEEFTTADYVRELDFTSSKLGNSIYNARDMGGYISSFGGVRINQGLIYRGSEINDVAFTYSGSHSVNVDSEVLQKNKDIFKIGLEIDFRKDNAISRTNSNDQSGLGQGDFPVEYMRRAYQSYASFVNNPNGLVENAIKDVMEAFANADEKHCYYHCWGGADRTGAMGFFLNGLLGVSLTDLYIDFDLTTQNNSLRSHLTANGDYDFPDMLEAIKAHELYDEDKTIADFCYDWFLANGVEAETLEQIRTIMIPGYEEGMEQLEAYPDAE